MVNLFNCSSISSLVAFSTDDTFYGRDSELLHADTQEGLFSSAHGLSASGPKDTHLTCSPVHIAHFLSLHIIEITIRFAGFRKSFIYTAFRLVSMFHTTGIRWSTRHYSTSVTMWVWAFARTMNDD